MALEAYQIHRITNQAAMDLVVSRHYMHRPAPCSVAFGLFKGFDLLGVVCYGTPSSAPLRRGIAGDEHALNVVELTRLWVDDSVPKNGESYLIGNTLKHAGKEIVVSFAEIEAGHVGTVYQASNWIYTGLSAKRTNWTLEYEEGQADLFGDAAPAKSKHGQTIADKYTAAEVRRIYGDAFSLRERPRKHRYVYINAKGKRRKELRAALKYQQMPYPKKETATCSPTS